MGNEFPVPLAQGPTLTLPRPARRRPASSARRRPGRLLGGTPAEVLRRPCDSAVGGVLDGTHTGPEAVAATHRLPGGPLDVSRQAKAGPATAAASHPAGDSPRLDDRSVRTVMPLIPVDVR
ncbi:hypothetical protein GCM10010287_27120 [Streptomyces variabilis]|uniref:Uncharacterized protein n=1 Tax=Streptomyces variabilis TaxID=67372 RepID=A0ABQ2TX69_9ACTN|nr:hypothetical protein GCM10010265_46700 [Streptomyces griseoincarnatus]GGT51677.1 hypothetical protein GCM10010287_27120 [Streptomyces variabilis]